MRVKSVSPRPTLDAAPRGSAGMSGSIESAPAGMRIFSTDHKVIGLQYALTSLLFLLAGFLFILLIRWHLAWPDAGVPLGGLLGEANARAAS